MRDNDMMLHAFVAIQVGFLAIVAVVSALAQLLGADISLVGVLTFFGAGIVAEMLVFASLVLYIRLASPKCHTLGRCARSSGSGRPRHARRQQTRRTINRPVRNADRHQNKEAEDTQKAEESTVDGTQEKE